MIPDKNVELHSELGSIIDEKHDDGDAGDGNGNDDDPTSIDYRVLAEILPKPPDLPFPLEPIFIPNELENLTLGKYGGIKFCVENSSQTELSDLSDLNEIKQKLNNLSLQLFNDYSKHIDRVKNASNYQIKRMIEEAVLKIYLVMQSRVDYITRGYTSTIERVRGACRTQLANTIAILNGLINAAKRRNESFIESTLRNRISELETALQQNELDMKQLQTKLEEVEEKYDTLNLEKTNIIMSRNSSLESFPSENLPPKVITVQIDAAVQVETPDEKRQSLERQVKNLLEQIDVLKSALSAVQSQVKTLNEKHDQYELQLKSFNDQINESKADNSKLEKQLLSKENELSVCKQKMKSSELRLNEMLTSLNKLRGEKAQLENDYAINRDNEMKQLKQKLDELLKIKEALEDECSSLRKELMHMKEAPKAVQSSDTSMNNYALREQALVAEVSHFCTS
ncbi:unnamed protein product [Trichobilharzia szidati]|nr:unnamed protein product [Trichobilharzia szidati]